MYFLGFSEQPYSSSSEAVFISFKTLSKNIIIWLFSIQCGCRHSLVQGANIKDPYKEKKMYILLKSFDSLQGFQNKALQLYHSIYSNYLNFLTVLLPDYYFFKLHFCFIGYLFQLQATPRGARRGSLNRVIAKLNPFKGLVFSKGSLKDRWKQTKLFQCKVLH